MKKVHCTSLYYNASRYFTRSVKQLVPHIIHYGNRRKRRERLSMTSSRQTEISDNCQEKEKLLCAFKLSNKEVQFFFFFSRCAFVLDCVYRRSTDLNLAVRLKSRFT